jgi:glycosyltransferase involved in cell wall biosynthesis
MRITVAIPTYNRADELRQTLASLTRVETDHLDDYEVLVIDNNSTDDTRAVVEGFQPAFAGHLRCVLESEQGLNHARNRAVAEAAHPVVAFLDDDVEVDVHWLCAVADAFSSSKPAAVGGKAYLIFPSSRPMWLPTACEGLLSKVDRGPTRRPAAPDELYGLNLSVDKNWIARVGSFRPDLDRVGSCLISGGEEELLQRIHDAGGNLLYEPAAVVGHRVGPHRLRRRWFWSRYYWDHRGSARKLTAADLSFHSFARASWHVARAAARVGLGLFAHRPRSAEMFERCRVLAGRMGAWVGFVERCLPHRR